MAAILAAALAAAAAISIVIYNEIHADPTDKGNFGYQTLGRERVLLMNDDQNTTCSIEHQSKSYNETVGSKVRKNFKSYWKWVSESAVSLYHLDSHDSSELWSANNGDVVDRLWSLTHCRHGNTHSSDPSIQKVSNYLPHSDTSNSIDTRDAVAATDATAGQIVMQNTPDAQVISSCYPDGIGTVYFDAVNGFYEYVNGQIAVDVAWGVWKTNSTGRLVKENPTLPADIDLIETVDGTPVSQGGVPVPPDDAHCDEVSDEGEGMDPRYKTEPFHRLAWERANLTGRWNRGNESGPLPTNDVLRLDRMTKASGLTTAGSVENFYRAWAPISDPNINSNLFERARGPMRFRLKRVDTPAADMGLDGEDYNADDLIPKNGLLLVDNVIASYPPAKAWAIPEGNYVPSGKKNVIGWTGAVSPVKYPTVGETGLKATAGLAFATNSTAAVAGWIGETKASMTYRWRYLNQIIGEPKPIPLTLQGDRLISTDDFELPNMIGDVEFKYEVELNAPYYDYLDYSGSKKLVGTKDYSERIRKVTSELNPKARGQGDIPLNLPSGGDAFFFRLRAGKSFFDQLEWQLEVRPEGKTAAQTNAFWIVSDGTWKTYLRTTTNVTSKTALKAGDYEFRIIGLDPKKTFGGGDVTEIPWSGKPLHAASNGAGWTKIHIDTVTGALMFQLMESEDSADFMTYSIVRSDYQDFALWSDAAPKNPGDPVLYTGAYYEGKGKQSGTSPDARQYPGELPVWNPGTSSNAMYWTEGFATGDTVAKGWKGVRAYEPFEKRLQTPNGWQAWNGQWVCSKWRDQEFTKGGNMAFQLGGDASGGLEFTSVSRAPRGVDQLTLKARIAQMASFDQFAYYFNGELESMKDYVFTARAVMATTDAATEFDGNGSISLVGYYQPGEGCYELRVERISGDADRKGTVRLGLYKWYREKKAMKARLLGYHRTTRAFQSQSYMRCSNAGSSSSDQKNGIYGGLFMRCRTVSGKAVIEAGIAELDTSTNKKLLSDSCSGVKHYYFHYTDAAADNPLTFGTFGFGSLNCPAQIIKPQRYKNGTSGTFGKPSEKPKNQDNGDITDDNFKCGNATVTYPGGDPDDMFKDSSNPKKYKNWTFNDEDYALGTVADRMAVTAKAPTGALELFTRNAQGSGDDEVSQGTQPVSGFRYNEVNWTVRNHEDTLVRLSTGDGSDDIVVDDVSFDQWCAASYDDQNGSGTYINADFNAKTPSQGCPTNWVYQNGWVTVNGTAHTVDLQPARVKGNGLVQVRAPLMDGLSDDRAHPENTRGIGLGMFTFNYRDADEHCVLKVQYRECAGATQLRDYTSVTNGWTDAAVFDFGSMTPEERKNAANKPISVYVGQHGFQGVMRVIVDPGVTEAVVKNPSLGTDYGRITITDFRASDEPPLDGSCWWGWNIRTTDDEMERSLDDSLDAKEPGLAAALNNSVTADTEPVDGEDDEAREKRFAQHVPFVQSPTFATNIVGEISFRARKLHPDDPATEVAVLGAKDGGVSEDSNWECLDVILVTNAVFSETYSYKTKVGNDYASFRLAVIGVEKVKENYKDRMLPKVPTPQRVLIDDVAISEAVRGKIAFDNVGAFRTPLERHEYVDNLFGIEQQPMCGESWSVQCEIYASQLKEEIDLNSAEVTFHWYRGDKWGYSKWADDPAAKSAKLARIANSDLPSGQKGKFIYRGSYAEASGAIVDPIYDSGAVVQYMLEVKYRTKGSEDPVTQLLTSGEWKKPVWYRGVDYNAQYGGFAAYTILDSIAYGYAWINEVNVYDGPDPDRDISGTNQFVEVAIPEYANISGWRLEFITGGLDENPDAPIYTNTVATFTDDPTLWSAGLVPSTKDYSLYGDQDSTYVFLAVGNKASATEAMMKDHYIDGAWKVRDEDQVGYQVNRSTGTIDCGMPIGIRLVRPSGVVEHEIVVAGTNRWDFYGPPYSWVYSATNYLARMQRLEPDGSWTGPRADAAFPQDYAISVVNSTNVTTDASVWEHWTKTPGRVNMCNGVKEFIDPNFPKPQGTMIRLYAQIEGGYFNQTIGEFVHTVSNVVLFVPKGEGLPNGTNITYQITNCWYELASVTETCKDWTREHPDKVGSRGTFSVPVAAYASNDVKVVAKTRVRADVEEALGPDNDYREAILKWLEAGMWGPRGNRQAFRNPGELHPTAFHTLGDRYIRDLRLTETYWLDIDPTVEGTVFQAGMCDPPQPKKPHIGPGEGEELDRNDIVLGVLMKIHNEAEGWMYAPYTLNGIEPGMSTMDHPASWNSVTFKITGYLQNGLDATKDPAKKWMPLRYFVFDEGSFDPVTFKAKIQVIDPFKQFADWAPFDTCPVFFRWDIDTRKFGAVGNDVLKPDSTFK